MKYHVTVIGTAELPGGEKKTRADNMTINGAELSQDTPAAARLRASMTFADYLTDTYPEAVAILCEPENVTVDATEP